MGALYDAINSEYLMIVIFGLCIHYAELLICYAVVRRAEYCNVNGYGYIIYYWVMARIVKAM